MNFIFCQHAVKKDEIVEKLRIFELAEFHYKIIFEYFHEPLVRILLILIILLLD